MSREQDEKDGVIVHGGGDEGRAADKGMAEEAVQPEQDAEEPEGDKKKGD